MSDKTVYFMRPVGKRGPVKIGCSIMPAKRLRDLEIWSPYMLEIAASAPGEHRHERALHSMFSDQRRHGEWFDWSPRLAEVVAHVAETGTLPPLEVPQDHKGWAAFAKANRGKMPRRNPETHATKYRIGKRVRGAEARAYGFNCHDLVRPDEVQAILESYQGFASPLPTAEEVALLDEYVDRLNALPRADRSYRAWLNWYRAQTRTDTLSDEAA